MAYTYSTWDIGEPITKKRMDNIENGIKEALEAANNAISVNETQASTLTTLNGNIGTTNNKISGIYNALGTDFYDSEGVRTNLNVTQVINSLRTDLGNNAADGSRAWSQLAGAGVSYDNGTGIYQKTLKQIFEQYPLTNEVITPAINTPSNTDTIMIDNNSAPVNTLARRIKHIYNAIQDTNAIIDHTQGDNDPIPNGLKQRMETAEGNIGTIQDLIRGTANISITNRLDHLDGGNINTAADYPARTIKELITELNNAHESTAYANNGVARSYEFIDDRFEAIEQEIANAHSYDGNAANESNTLNKRLYNIDGGNVPSRTLPNIITEIANAHRDNNDTLDARFDAIDDTTNNNSIVSRVNALGTDKISTDKIFNDLTREANIAGYVLDARQGKVLKDMIGTGFDSTNTVAARIDAIDNATTGTVAVLTSRVNDINTEVTNARTSSVITDTQTEEVNGETVTTQVPHTYNSVDDRLEAIETHAAAVRTDINTIADELSMRDQQVISGVNTRVDRLNDNVLALGKEIGMLSEDATLLPLSDAIDRDSTRIDNITTEINAAHRTGLVDVNEDPITDTLDNRFDDIESDISDLSNAIDHVHGENDELPDGLKQRLTAAEGDIDTLESDLNTATTGVKARVTALETTVNTATTGLVDKVTSITTRLTTLEGKDTVVIDYDGEHSNYTIQNDQQVPTYATPTENADYLIADDEGNYYYWRYINSNWKMISGGGSGGSGNSSGYVLTAAQYRDLQTKSLNTDYYVIDDDKIHHYRWIPSETPGENTQIEITQIIDTNNIKRYLVAKHERNNSSNEPATYLDFYEFAYGVNPEINDENHSLNRIAAIELPKGGGSDTVSSDTVCLVSYVSAQNQLLTQEIAENEGVKISFFYLAYTKQVEDNETFYLSQPCSYTLKKGNRIIASDTLKARDVITDSNGNPVTLTDEYKRLNATTIDVTKYCKVNEDNDFTLTVTTTGVTPRIRPFHIEVVELGLNSTFNDQTVFNANTNLRIPLTISSPERTKTIYVKLDEGTEAEYEITQIHGEKASSNTTITIPAEKLTPGLHSVRIYFEEVISGESPATSNELLFDLACRDVNNDTTILLASPYRGKIKELNQYKTFKFPYYLYIPDGMSTNIVKINGATGRTTIEEGHTGEGEFLFKATQPSTIENNEMIPFTLTIGCQEENSQNIDPSFTIQVKVIANEYNIEPVLDNLVFDFNPIGYINNPQNEEDKYWKDENNSSIRLSEVEGANFDWDNGGWKYDEDMEAPYFCVKAGSRAQINYSLFQDNMEAAGSAFKCIFKAVNVRDPEAIFLTSLDKQTSTVISYSPEKMSSDQNADGYKADAADDDKATLFSSYFNVKEGRVLTYKKGSLDATKIALSVLDNGTIQYSLDNEENTEWLSDPENELDTSYIMTDARFNAALDAAKKKVIKKNTTDYAKNIINYVKAYEGPEASDLRTLMIGPSDNETSILLGSTVVDNKTVYNADTIFTTLQESNDWANFRETTTYNDQIVIDLETLVKNLKNLTYATEIVTTTNFTKMIIVDDHDDEYEQKLVKTIYAQKTNGDIVETQIEIAYELDDHDNKIYNDIYLVREVLNKSERAHGLEMRAHRANIHLGSGTLTYPYSEEDIIEFEYNISNPISRKKTAPILMYEDGVPSASMLYSTNSSALVQADKGNLIIGSDDCDIQIYRMKFYNKKLNNIEILSNFYADALNPTDMIDRYETNIATYTDSADPDSITPQSIAASCPELRVIMIEAPNLTSGKNSFIKNSKIRCIYKGENARPEDNWVALNAYHAGQGTSSDAYGAAGRNLDIIFGFNGRDQLIAPKAKNNYRFDPDYKSILITGVDDTDNAIGTADSYIDEIFNNLNDGKIETDDDYITRQELLERSDFTDDHLHVYLNGTGKVNFNDQAVPNSWFNIKLNIASSENTNNALLQKRYDRYLKEIYQTPAQKRDNRIKNDMEFFNCVVFIRETSDNRNEFNDNNWHFYGIGNIGDSKKTDDTRVNIPNDPFEFCVEVSDNGLTNSGFSSGVYWTDATKTTTTYNPTGSYEIKYPVTQEEWENENNTTYAALIDYEEDGGWDKSLEFRYDVSTKDGNTIADNEAEEALALARQEHNKEVFKNMYEWVVTAPTDGNDSFANHLRDWFIEESPLYWYVFTERYTMIDSRAKNTFYHFGKVYVLDEEIDGETAAECTRVQAYQAILTTALQGNDEIAIANAKTAYDTAVFVWENKDCFISPSNNKYYTTTINGVQKGAAEINDGYRFDMWDYDNDTALGINNNGQMVFDAGLEDIDRTANAWVYNEATNVFWRRIRNEMQNKLRSVYTSRKADCFNAENLIKEFDEWQAQFPENLWRLDFERKYYRPYLEGNNMRYLRDMANGRKKYQRREFERNMCIYIDSKYVLADAYDPDDFIQFRPTSQQDANQDKMINITCYSPMYINFSIGNQTNTPGSHERCMAGETKSFDFFAGITDAQNIQTKIFNASRIKEITGLENYYADDLDFTAASKLRKITLGSNVAKLIDPNTGEESTIPYRNNNTKTLVLGVGNPILEELDIRNCVALASELDLTECISLDKLYATGTPLTKVNLAAGGLIKELYLPATMTALEFNNLYLLDTVQLAGYNNIISYISSNIFRYNSKTLIYNVLSHLTELKLNDIDWVIGNIDELEQFKQKQLELGSKMVISGKIKITGNYSDIELQDYDNFWKHKIIFDATQGTKQTRWKITYKYDDYYNADTEQTVYGDTIKTLYVADGAQIPDIWEYWDDEKQEIVNILTTEDGWTNPPSRNSTKSTIYTFGTYTDNQYNEYSGWKYEDAISPLNTAIYASGHTTLYTYFKTTDRTYTINWYLKLEDDGTGTSRPVDLVKSSGNVKYGQGYDQIAPTVQDIHDAYSRSTIQNSTYNINIEDGIATYEIFDGWQRLPTNINPDGSSNNFNIFAKWKTGQLVLNNGVINDIQNLSVEELFILSNLPLSSSTGPSRTKCAPNFVTSQTIDYKMGHDYDTTISPIMNTQRNQNTPIWHFDRNDNPMTINSIMPFSQTSIEQGWTLAIDYSFVPDVNYNNPSTNFYPNAAVLAGCYDVVGEAPAQTIIGFALYENRNSSNGPIGPCLGFGDMFNQAGQVISLGQSTNIGERDIVVIRKPKNSSSIIVYRGKDGAINSTIISTEKSWNKVTTEAKLELGRLSHSSLSAIVARAKGTIYWTKYWNEDLGAGECARLAAWPHETITFGVANNNSNTTSRNRLSPENTAITLTAISSSNYGVLPQAAAGKSYGDITGWKTSTARTICNSRIFQGLPTTLQSIICKSSVGTKNLEIRKDGGGSNITVLTNVDAVRDYIYLPSVSNYITDTDYQQEGSLYPWVNSTGITIYTYTVAGSEFTQDTSSAVYKNLRFPGQPISLSTLRILNINGQASNFKDIFNGENSPFGAIVSGDIVIENNQKAYMYVSSNDIISKGLQVEQVDSENDKLYTDGIGGWLLAQEHWTRSIGHTSSTNYYIYVDNESGSIQTNSPNSTGLHLNYSFSV